MVEDEVKKDEKATESASVSVAALFEKHPDTVADPDVALTMMEQIIATVRADVWQTA